MRLEWREDWRKGEVGLAAARTVTIPDGAVRREEQEQSGRHARRPRASLEPRKQRERAGGRGGSREKSSPALHWVPPGPRRNQSERSAFTSMRSKPRSPPRSIASSCTRQSTAADSVTPSA